MIDFCTVVVLDFELKKVYLQANSLHWLGTVVEETHKESTKEDRF